MIDLDKTLKIAKADRKAIDKEKAKRITAAKDALAKSITATFNKFRPLFSELAGRGLIQELTIKDFCYNASDAEVWHVGPKIYFTYKNGLFTRSGVVSMYQGTIHTFMGGFDENTASNARRDYFLTDDSFVTFVRKELFNLDA